MKAIDENEFYDFIHEIASYSSSPLTVASEAEKWIEQYGECDATVHAHWILKGGRWTCTRCGKKSLAGLTSNVGGCKEFGHVRSNFCPNCGAKMDEEKVK